MLHHPRPMNLDSAHANTQIECDELVGTTGRKRIENLPFAQAEGRNQLRRPDSVALPADRVFLLQRGFDRLEQVSARVGFSRTSTAPAFMA
jgi:hypothetical protein